MAPLSLRLASEAETIAFSETGVSFVPADHPDIPAIEADPTCRDQKERQPAGTRDARLVGSNSAAPWAVQWFAVHRDGISRAFGDVMIATTARQPA